MPNVSEPYRSRTEELLINTLAVPIYDENRNIVGILSAGAVKVNNAIEEVNDIAQQNK